MPLFASGLSIFSYTGNPNISSVVEESQRLVQVNIEHTDRDFINLNP
ncbi:uncharacterized protein RSE6_13096 [Rhynchosporium secalis]|uniref:Uncharacterized protein n=1 Tax=Rhynchosporium secalis TaxID=38038 RepID=A0A1E1MS49_RHYSE|nr:uncharacterized protein RSE6_13096 [Rhynchosporium secalis]